LCWLTEQSAGKHVATLGHSILIPRQGVFALTPYGCVRKAENTNVIVFGLIRPGL